MLRRDFFRGGGFWRRCFCCCRALKSHPEEDYLACFRVGDCSCRYFRGVLGWSLFNFEEVRLEFDSVRSLIRDTFLNGDFFVKNSFYIGFINFYLTNFM